LFPQIAFVLCSLDALKIADIWILWVTTNTNYSDL
jgi:hypothetical protein